MRLQYWERNSVGICTLGATTNPGPYSKPHLIPSQCRAHDTAQWGCHDCSLAVTRSSCTSTTAKDPAHTQPHAENLPAAVRGILAACVCVNRNRSPHNTPQELLQRQCCATSALPHCDLPAALAAHTQPTRPQPYPASPSQTYTGTRSGQDMHS